MKDQKSYGDTQHSRSHAVRTACFALPVSLLGLVVYSPRAAAVDQSLPSAGNAAAAQFASSSALVQSARRFIANRITKISEKTLAKNVRELVEDPKACVRHRAGESSSSKQSIVNALAAAGLVSTTDAASFPGGAVAGVLPPVLDPGSTCPHLPQPFFSAPGSVFGGHHSYPGGLPIHESFNDLSDGSLAANYRRVYGHSGWNGLPVIASADDDHDQDDRVDVDIDEDIIIAAPLLHDWAKPLVFQWNACQARRVMAPGQLELHDARRTWNRLSLAQAEGRAFRGQRWRGGGMATPQVGVPDEHGHGQPRRH